MYNCKYCGKECKNDRSLRNHERLCKSNPSYDAKKFCCKYCGKYFSRIDRLHLHEESCSYNPCKIPCRTAWNRGLTKENNETIKRKAETLSYRIANGEVIGCYGLRGENNYSTKLEVKAKISKTMIGNHNNDPSKTGRGKKGWYKGFFCSSTYELAFIIYCLDKGIPVKKCSYVYDYEYEGKKHKYYPDFIVNNTIIEIKGFYTEKVRIKTESVKDRPIVVLYRKDLKEVFDYIEFTYNKTVDKNIHELYQDRMEE